MKTRSATATMLSLVVTILLAPLAPGCGESEPPPMEAKDLEALQKKQMEMIEKEYGARAVKGPQKKR